MALAHSFISLKSDPVDQTLVGASAWNAPHILGGPGVTIGDLLYADVAGGIVGLSSAAAGQILASNGVGVAPYWSPTLGLIRTSAPTVEQSLIVLSAPPATVSNHVQLSGALTWIGQTWDTNSATSRPCQYDMAVRPDPGDTVRSVLRISNLDPLSSARTYLLTLSDFGNLAVLGSVTAAGVLAADGSAAAPAYRFASDPDTGFFSAGGDDIGVSLNGGERFRFSDAGTFYHLDLGSGALEFGSALGSPDVILSSGAANRFDLASGDSLYLVSGGLGVGVAPPGAGQIATSGNIDAGGGEFLGTAGSRFFLGTSGQAILRNWEATDGIGLDFATDGTLKIRNRAHDADANLTAALVDVSSGIGTFTALNLNLYAGGLIRWVINTSTGALLANGVYDIGDPTGNAPNTIYAETSLAVTSDTGILYFGNALDAALLRTSDGGLSLRTAGANRWSVDADGTFLAGADNTYDIGGASNSRPRSVFITGAYYLGGTVQLNHDGDGSLMLRNYGGTGFTSLKFGGAGVTDPCIKRNISQFDFRNGTDTDYVNTVQRVVQTTEWMTGDLASVAPVGAGNAWYLFGRTGVGAVPELCAQMGTGPAVRLAAADSAGTWIPTLSAVGGAGNVMPVYATTVGSFTKLGRLVFWQISLQGDGGTDGAGTGQLQFLLPFPASADQPIMLTSAGIAYNGADELIVYLDISPSSTVAKLWKGEVTGGQLSIVPFTPADQDNTTRRMTFQGVLTLGA